MSTIFLPSCCCHWCAIAIGIVVVVAADGVDVFVRTNCLQCFCAAKIQCRPRVSNMCWSSFNHLPFVTSLYFCLFKVCWKENLCAWHTNTTMCIHAKFTPLALFTVATAAVAAVAVIKCALHTTGCMRNWSSSSSSDEWMCAWNQFNKHWFIYWVACAILYIKT